MIAKTININPGEMVGQLVQHLGTSYVVQLKSRNAPKAELSEEDLRQEKSHVGKPAHRTIVELLARGHSSKSKIVQNEQLLVVN
ncbi:MAG: hypothetical protein R2827_09040 [Bdellovibrionales bacterium]